MITKFVLSFVVRIHGRIALPPSDRPRAFDQVGTLHLVNKPSVGRPKRVDVLIGLEIKTGEHMKHWGIHRQSSEIRVRLRG